MAQIISLRIPDELIEKIEYRMKIRQQKRTEVILSALNESFLNVLEPPGAQIQASQAISEQPDEPFGIAGVVWGTQGIDELTPVITKELATEQELCGYRAYNDVDGEWYRCGREKGHGIKHSEWIKET